MWISYSPDLIHWGDHRVLIQARRGGWWDARKIGLSPQPIETKDGWLLLYHGVRETAAGALYRLGLVLLDLEEPTEVLLRSDEWVFGPQTEYERVGDVADVVFPCGATVAPDGDTLYTLLRRCGHRHVSRHRQPAGAAELAEGPWATGRRRTR